MNSTKLTNRTGAQVTGIKLHGAPEFLLGATTITFPGTAAETLAAIDQAINAARQAGDKGSNQALHSVRRAALKAQEAEATAATHVDHFADFEPTFSDASDPADLHPEPTGQPTKAEAKAHTDAKTAKEQKLLAKAAKATNSKETAMSTTTTDTPKLTGPRGEVLARLGTVEGDHTVKLAFKGFEGLKANDKAAEVKWLVRCNEHGTTTPAANGTEAERLGATKARNEWCSGCKKAAAKAAKA